MSDVDDKIENGEESENQLVDHFDELKTLGELQIQNENVEKTSENSNQKSDEKVEEEAASQKSEILTKKRSESSISSDSNSVDSSHRSSLPSLSGILSSFSGRGSELWSNSSPARSPPIDDDKPDFQAQRKNLSLVAKIATRALIDPCLEKSILIEEFYPPLVQFLYVLECVLLHGWKQKTSMFNRNRSFWAVFDNKQMESMDPQIKDTNRSVRDMPGIKTGIGRARAFLRISLMQKKLPDYLDILQASENSFMAEYWDDHALLRNDEAPEIFGHMQGLSIVDANLHIKGTNLDGQIGVIDFSLMTAVTDASNEKNRDFLEQENKRLIDQKSFLEERNRQLEDRLKIRSDKLESTDETKTQYQSELKAAKITIKELQSELASTKEAALSDTTALKESFAVQKIEFKSKLDSMEKEISDARQNYNQIESQLKNETKDRLEYEKMLEQEIKQKQQLEIGIRLLERDAYEKQDSLDQLQKQLEDTRSINQRLFEEIREKNDREKERIRKLDESKQAISALRTENENIYEEHERLKIQENETADMKLRFESEIDELKIKLLKYESDFNQESDLRRVAENEAESAKMVAQNLLRESQKYMITRDSFSRFK